MRCGWIVSASVAVSGVASAEPCHVTIAHAPAELRATIDDALSAESHCRVALELRIVSTEGGYYMLARDPHGHTRERIVPDAASVATLVASWAADDELDDSGQQPRPRITALPPPIAAPEAVVVASAAPPSPTHGPTLALYGVIGPEGVGWRADLDVVHRGRWSLGVSAARLSVGASITDDDRDPTLSWEQPVSATEYDVLGYVSYRRDLSEAWHVRGALGAGVAILDVTFDEPFDNTSEIVFAGEQDAGFGGLAAAPLVEAMASIDADLAYGLSLVAGVKLDGHIQSPTFDYLLSPDDTGHVSLDRPVTWSLLGGLRYEL